MFVIYLEQNGVKYLMKFSFAERRTVIAAQFSTRRIEIYCNTKKVRVAENERESVAFYPSRN